MSEDTRPFTRRRRRIEDFRYDPTKRKFLDTTTGMWLSPKSVNGAIPRDDWPTRPDGRPIPPAEVIRDGSAAQR